MWTLEESGRCRLPGNCALRCHVSGVPAPDSGVGQSVLLLQGPHQSIQVCVVWEVCVCKCAFQNPNVYGYKCVRVPLYLQQVQFA